ncbi:MAG TPA: trehalose-phosphatase [Gemmatimonadaceae bacterium]|nr:trehalose-phosphatase [Gemmatimonadaceae bacterium]
MTGAGAPGLSIAVEALPPTASFARRLSGSPLLVLLDIDGTLAPIAPTPDEAAVPAATRQALDALTRSPGVHVAAVTGRAARDGRGMLGAARMWVIGNHGMERMDPSGTLVVSPHVAPYQPAIADAVVRLSALLAAIRGVIVENKGLTLSVHYRLADHALVSRIDDSVRSVAGVLGLRVTHGKEVLELRPPVAVDKGTAALDLARELGVLGTEPQSSILYAGDDRTDEDAFRLIRARCPNSVTIHVGSAIVNGVPTAAEFAVADTERVRAVLEWLLSARDRNRSADRPGGGDSGPSRSGRRD